MPHPKYTQAPQVPAQRKRTFQTIFRGAYKSLLTTFLLD